MDWLAILTNKWVAIPLAAVMLAAGMWIAGDVHGHRAQLDKDAGKYVVLQAGYAQKLADAETKARAKERADAETMSKIDARHAQELNDAKQDAAGVIAGLKSGNLRLRDEWTACRATAAGVPAPGTSTGQPDATAELRAALAAAIVQVGADADADERALQAILKSERNPGGN